MSTVSFKDYFSKGAVDYAKYRPTYPPALFQQIADECIRHDLAWDCGTGNGQAALGLTSHFAQVIATDASTTQIENAFASERISYRVATAENSGIESGTVDAVTVAQALHWFDHDSFYAEVKRTLRSGGVFATWCYGRSSVNEDIDTIIKDMHMNLLHSYWAPEVRFVEEQYKSLNFPFTEFSAPEYYMESQWNFDEYLGYLNTWSAVQKCLADRGLEPFKTYFERVLRAWTEPGKKRRIVTRLFVRMGRA
jgi:SAM-dependent methyltransferase